MRALLSVDDKTGLIALAQGLQELGWDLVATDGTRAALLQFAQTALADAAIDSPDALTILFAIEETFKISVPDDRARSMKTFGDMIDTIEKLVPA